MDKVIRLHREADVVGSIYRARETWRKTRPCDEVWSVVSGLRIEAEHITPGRVDGGPNLSAEMTEKLQKEVDQLLFMGAISEQASEVGLFLSPIFAIPKSNSDAIRLIHDLRRVNSQLHPRKFRMRGLAEVATTMQRGDAMLSLDMKKGYYQVLLHPDHRRKAGFRHNGRVFAFNVMPFGLSTAPRAYTAIVRHMTNWLRKRFSVRIVAYLDDWLFFHNDAGYLASITVDILNVLYNFGFIVSVEKCVLRPQTAVRYLGVIVNSEEGSLILTEDKRAAYLKLVQNVLRERRTMTHVLRSLSGKLSFCRVVCGDSAAVRSRELQRLVNRLVRGHALRVMKTEMKNQLIEDLEWWKGRLATPPRRSVIARRPTVRIETDASTEGLGAVIFTADATQSWKTSTAGLGHLHITSLETLAAVRAIKEFWPRVRGQKVRLLTDSTTAAKWVRVSGIQASEKVEREIKELHQLLDRSGTELVTCHIQGRLNWTADRLSRPTTFEGLDWPAPEELLLQAARKWGTLERDLFQAPGRGREGDVDFRQDAMSTEWSGRCLIVPPLAMLPMVAQRLRQIGARSEQPPALQPNAALVIFPDCISNAGLTISDVATGTLTMNVAAREYAGTELASIAGRSTSLRMKACWVTIGSPNSSQEQSHSQGRGSAGGNGVQAPHDRSSIE